MDPLGPVIPWLAAGGSLGLLGVTLLERLVPMLPSKALLVAIGIAVADGHWSLHTALLMSTAGSLLGCLAFYALGWALGEARGVAVLTRSARFLGVAPAKVEGWMVDVRGREWLLAFGSQLIPTVRLMAPGVAGLLRVKPRAFFGATTLGLTVWNTLFIGAGYAAARTTGSPNASTLALKTLVVLLIGEGIATTAWHVIARRRRETGQARRERVNKGAGRRADGVRLPGLRLYRVWGQGRRRRAVGRCALTVLGAAARLITTPQTKGEEMTMP